MRRFMVLCALHIFLVVVSPLSKDINMCLQQCNRPLSDIFGFGPYARCAGFQLDIAEYITEEDAVQVIQERFSDIDSSPTDGLISRAELKSWVDEQERKADMQREQHLWDVIDSNKDNTVSLEEFRHLPDPEKWAYNNTLDFEVSRLIHYKCLCCVKYIYHLDADSYFNACDANGDGVVDRGEFRDMMYPEESKSSRLYSWLFDKMDNDHDGIVDGLGFHSKLYYFTGYYGQDVYPSLEYQRILQRKRQHEKWLTVADGVERIVLALNISRNPYAIRLEADSFVAEYDQDKDGQLSLSEILSLPRATRRIALVAR